jgi:hypothetical protein
LLSALSSGAIRNCGYNRHRHQNRQEFRNIDEEKDVDQLALMTKPAVPHVVFGIFNLAWPNIAFWALVVVVFGLAAWARMPAFMESDAASRRGGDGREHR